MLSDLLWMGLGLTSIVVCWGSPHGVLGFVSRRPTVLGAAVVPVGFGEAVAAGFVGTGGVRYREGFSLTRL